MADDYDPKDPTGGSTAKEDEPILDEIREWFDYDQTNWEPIRLEADKDVKYCAGNTWDADDEALRKGRPILKLDQLSQYLNQLENTVRQNKRAIKASPAGNGATEQTAELRSNRIREIEYQSHAQEAYIQAFANCAMRSYGFCRIVADYEDVDTPNQVLRIKAIANPNQVVPDSDGESTSGRDWMRLFFVRTVTHAEFRRDWPDADIKDFSPDLMVKAPSWIKDKRVQIAEYWKVTETHTGVGRPKREVCQYLTNGVELLHQKGRPKKTPWKGKYIPFASCYGKILYLNAASGDSEKVMLSYIRLARDAAKYYNWIKSTEGEVLSMVPKSVLFAYEGQLTPENLLLLARATYEPVPVIFAQPTTPATGSQILPLPQRNLLEPPVQAYEIAAESARRDVQNALGRYSASDHRLGNTKVTSGVALKELDKSGDLGSYHFIDHYDDMIMFIGEQLDDLLPAYDDTPKEVAVRLPDGSVKMQRINTPTQRGPNGQPVYGPEDARMDVGRHAITLSTGPSFDSQREAGKEAAMGLLSNPQAFPIIASDAIRLMDLGPVGDQMAEDLEWLQPPPMQQAKAEKEKKVDPRQLQQQMAEMGERLKEAEKVMHAQQQELQTRQQDAQTKLQMADADAQTKLKLADMAADKELALQVMKNAAQIATAHIAAAAKGVAMTVHAEEEAQALGHEAEQADRDRLHEANLTAMQHQQGLEARQLGHQQSLEAGDVGHAQTLEQAEQQAALQPPPPPPTAL